jgi:iron complex outermembrane receptor protein
MDRAFESSLDFSSFDQSKVAGRSQNFASPPPFSTFRFDQESSSVAGFGQATYSLTDWLRLTAGGRYTHDRKEVSQLNSFPPLNPCTGGARFQNSWSEFTPKAGIDVIPTDDLFLYATYSKGYKAGGFNLTNCGDNFDPEVITAYEGGLKAQLLDKTLSLSLTGFYYDYSDFQANLFVALANEIVNAAEATVKGAELETTWLPPFVAGVTVHANGGFLDATFDKLSAADSFRPLDGNQNLAGNRIPRAPKFTASAGVGYELAPFDAARLALHVNHRYSDDFFFDIFNDPVAHQGAYDQTDATVTLGTSGEGLLGGWELSGFVKNIENRAVLISAIPTVSVFGVIGEYAAPRTFGFHLAKRFG